MNIVGSLLAWRDAMTDQHFRQACAYHEVLPHQVGTARTLEALEELRLSWLGSVRAPIMTKLLAAEEEMYGHTISINDERMHGVVYWAPDFVSEIGGRRSSFHFHRLKGDGVDIISVETWWIHHVKPMRSRRIPIDALNLRELRELRIVLGIV